MTHLPGAETSTETPNVALFLVGSQLPDSRVIMLDYFHQEGGVLCSYWKGSLLAHRFAYRIVSYQGTHLTAK